MNVNMDKIIQLFNFILTFKVSSIYKQMTTMVVNTFIAGNNVT